MKYRILAHSKDTGQKLTLEFEAQSKADAERKAKPHNVNIIRIEPAEPVPGAQQKQWTTLEPRRSFKIPWLLILLLFLAAAAYIFWPTIRTMIPASIPPLPPPPLIDTPIAGTPRKGGAPMSEIPPNSFPNRQSPLAPSLPNADK